MFDISFEVDNESNREPVMVSIDQIVSINKTLQLPVFVSPFRSTFRDRYLCRVHIRSESMKGSVIETLRAELEREFNHVGDLVVRYLEPANDTKS